MTPTAPTMAIDRNASPEGCEEASIDAMTDGVNPFDDHEETGLDPSRDARIDLPPRSVDLLDASSIECSAHRDHSEASLGRHLGHQHEVNGDHSPQTNAEKADSRMPKGDERCADEPAADRSISCKEALQTTD